MMKNIHVLEAARQKFPYLPADLERSLQTLSDPEDLEALVESLDKCSSVAALSGLVTWFEGRQSGRIDGLRRAVYTLLGYRDDAAADRLEERAFESSDPHELERLLMQAANLKVPSRN